MNKLYLTALALGICLFTNCTQNAALTHTEATAVKDSVQDLAANTAKNLHLKGPLAWLDYFENTPDFSMASDGQVVFANYAAADTFIKNKLAREVSVINLKWDNIRIIPISADYALMAADFHEDLTVTGNTVLPYDGYFTATAHQTAKGWKYVNLHWSIKKVK